MNKKTVLKVQYYRVSFKFDFLKLTVVLRRIYQILNFFEKRIFKIIIVRNQIVKFDD